MVHRPCKSPRELKSPRCRPHRVKHVAGSTRAFVRRRSPTGSVRREYIGTPVGRSKVLHVGPKGGRYLMVGGKKRYVQHSPRV
jgi:hypothetical protein